MRAVALGLVWLVMRVLVNIGRLERASIDLSFGLITRRLLICWLRSIRLKVVVHVWVESLLSSGRNIGSVPTILAGGIDSALRDPVWSVDCTLRASSRRIG